MYRERKMTRLKNVFAVSFIAMFAVGAANATIVTQENIVGANGVSVSVPASGQTNAGKVVVTGPTVGNATLTIQKNGTAVDTFTANATSNKTINITVPTTAADVSAVPTTRKVAGHALSSDVTLSKGDVGLGNVDNTSDANKPISTATQAALDGKQDYALVDYTSGDDYAAMKTGYIEMTDEYPSVATVGQWIKDTSDNLGGVAGNKQDKLVSTGTGANVTYSGSGNVVTNVSATGGVVTVTKGTTLGGLATKSAVGSSEITDGSIMDTDVNASAAISTGKSAIPSGWTNTQSAAALAAGDTVTVALGKLEKKVDSKQASGSYEASGTASGLINALDVSTSSGDGNVVTAVTQTDGKISVTKGTTLGGLATKSAVGSSEITDGAIMNADVNGSAAISTAKLAIPSGWTNTQTATALAAGDTVSAALGKLEKKVDGKQASGSYVPTTRTVNGHALSSDVTVTKADVGLGNVNNTSDANKPISTATQEALDSKQDYALVDYVSGDEYANMKTNYLEMADEYPSVATVGKWIKDTSDNLGGNIGNKQDKLVSSGTGANVNFTGSGNVVANISATGGTVTVTKSRVQIPSGSETATSYASIWVE